MQLEVTLLLNRVLVCVCVCLNKINMQTIVSNANESKNYKNNTNYFCKKTRRRKTKQFKALERWFDFPLYALRGSHNWQPTQ